MGIKSKRVSFVFDEQALKTLEQPTSRDDWAAMGWVESPNFTRALNLSALRRPLRSLIIRDPATGEEREVWIPRLATFRPALGPERGE